jgi:hypothetical protein
VCAETLLNNSFTSKVIMIREDSKKRSKVLALEDHLEVSSRTIMKYLWVLVFFAIFSKINCRGRGGRAINRRIVGGNETSIEAVPHQIALLYIGFHRCGGSILSCKYVLTAAHCTERISPTLLTGELRRGSKKRFT